MRRVSQSGWIWFALVFLILSAAARAETLPAKPANYFNDYSGVVSATTAQRLDEELKEFERTTSNQIVVAVYSKLETDSSVQDYTFRIAESWKVGQVKKDNGAVLFVFTEPRKIFIQVGYGLEGALPDITCKQIIANEITPAFKSGNFDAGLIAGVESMIKATRGEYRGSGRTVAEGRGGDSFGFPVIIAIFVGLFIISRIFRRSGTVYGSNGRRAYRGGWFPPIIGGGGGGWGGGSGGGGGGGFSGGGGSFGGGGAGGDW
ncbi:MAG: hypothetical protein JWL59_2697 [Chthoniobacteraceae bacterium]|nr:hypothetical protein [Chthoniobacteraceae bacterium]